MMPGSMTQQAPDLIYLHGTYHSPGFSSLDSLAFGFVRRLVPNADESQTIRGSINSEIIPVGQKTCRFIVHYLAAPFRTELTLRLERLSSNPRFSHIRGYICFVTDFNQQLLLAFKDFRCRVAA